MKKSVVITIGVIAAIVAAVVVTTFGQAKYRVEVCKEFRGVTACRTASAATETEALRTANSNACAQMAGGVSDVIECESRTPFKSVKWLAGRK